MMSALASQSRLSFPWVLEASSLLGDRYWIPVSVSYRRWGHDCRDPVCHHSFRFLEPHEALVRKRAEYQKNSRRLWRSRRRKSSSIPAGAANFPAAIFLAGKFPNLGRDSISCCRKIGEEFSSSVEICRKTFPASEFRTATAFSSFLISSPPWAYGFKLRTNWV